MGGFPFAYMIRFPVLENINFLNLSGPELWFNPKHSHTLFPGLNLFIGALNGLLREPGLFSAMTRG
jgi:hypothetical protein